MNTLIVLPAITSILALLFVPVFAWVVYGIWRMRQSRGL